MGLLKLRRPKRKTSAKSALPAKSVEPALPSAESFLDVLNRDQRTIVTINRFGERRGAAGDPERRFPAKGFPFPERRDAAGTHVRSFVISNSGSALDRFVRKMKSRSWGSRRTFVGLVARLSEVFIVGVCLLTVVRVPTAMSAPSARHAKATEPIHSRKSHAATENDLSYLHPCGKNREEEMNNTYYQMSPREIDPDILQHIIIRTNNSLSYAESFKDLYVEKTFHLPFHRHHDLWRNTWYNWLPNEHAGIPKGLGYAVDPLHLKDKTLDEFLVEIYEHLQKFAVGLEQIVADQKRTGGEFQENFRKTEVHLKNVLCEIREAMMERNVAPKNQVPRSIMEDDVRQLDSPSRRNLRDWIIFRDLMNCLEYVIQVFCFIKETLPRSSAASS